MASSSSSQLPKRIDPFAGKPIKDFAPNGSEKAFVPGVKVNASAVGVSGNIGYGVSMSPEQLSDEEGTSIRELMATSVPELVVGHANFGVLQGVMNNIPDELNPFVDARTSPPGDKPEQIVATPMSFDQGSFSLEDGVTRTLILSRINFQASPMDVAMFFNPEEFHSLKAVDTSQYLTGNVFVLFHDVRDAVRAYQMCTQAHTSWEVHFLKLRALVTLTNSTVDAMMVSNHEGCVLVIVQCHVTHPKIDDPEQAYRFVLEELQHFGLVKAAAALTTVGTNMKQFVFEFFDARHAPTAVRELNNTGLGSYHITVTHYRPDVCELSPPHTVNGTHGSGDNSPTPPGRPSQDAGNYGSTTSSSSRGLTDTSLTAFTGPGPLQQQFDDRNDDLDHVRNTVYLNVVAHGQDVRTTVMIRGIPQRVHQHQLKAVLDRFIFGVYDFMYLRIDFSKGTNVGYAFVNIPDPMNIIALAQSISGQRWSAILAAAGINIQVPMRFDRQATISYATVQGRDCLVQKFRNSNIMLEATEHRPKLFHAYPDPSAGLEEPFPEPDNWMKLRRSIANAETIGLFAPRMSQQNRIAQRFRRSPFDRGTTAAEREAHLEGRCDTSRNELAITHSMTRPAPEQLPNFYGY